MRKSVALICAGLLFLTVAACLAGYNVWQDYRAGNRSGEAVAQLQEVIPADPAPEHGRIVYQRSAVTGEELTEYPDSIEYPDYVLDPDMNMPVKNVDGMDYVGTLTIPALELELPVCSDWNYENLKSAPCRFTGTVYHKDMVICAHNYSRHFGKIASLRYGDSVEFTDTDGNVFSYTVTEIETLQSTAVEEMTGSGHALTLFTCTLGGESRVTVRCD